MSIDKIVIFPGVTRMGQFFNFKEEVWIPSMNILMPLSFYPQDCFFAVPRLYMKGMTSW